MDRLTLTSYLRFHFNLSRSFLLGKRAKRVQRSLCLFAGQCSVRSFVWWRFSSFWQFERRAGCVNMQVEQCRHQKYLWMTTVLQYWMEGGFCGTIRSEKTCAVSGKGDLILHKWTEGDNWADKCLVLHKEDERTKCSTMSGEECEGGEQCCNVKAASPGAPCPSILSVSR